MANRKFSVFTEAYGDIDEAFYNSLESSFHDACKLIQTEQLEKEFQPYCEELIQRTENFGWGVYDGLSYSYDEFLK